MTSIYSLSVTQNWREIWISIPISLEFEIEFVEPNLGANISLSQHALWGESKARLTGALSKGGMVRWVATNVYLWKTSEKPKETGQKEYSKFRSYIYVWGRY